jgi:hypothetical protein
LINASTVARKTAAALMNPVGDKVLQRWPVSKRVNSSRAANDDATLIDRMSETVPSEQTGAFRFRFPPKRSTSRVQRWAKFGPR